MAVAEKSWAPVRQGRRYCSPACGHGCTWAAHERAAAQANALAFVLGKGWRPRVWENLGWHWAAISASGAIKVHPNGRSYTALFGHPGSPGGRWVEKDTSAREAVRRVRAAAQAEVDSIAALLQAEPCHWPLPPKEVPS